LTPANNYDPQVIIMGGDNPATASTEVIDLGTSNPAWTQGPAMSQARIEMNAVMLPSGAILALGGAANDEDTSAPSLKADLYHPDTDSFSSAGSNSFARLYHSVALLLPDATVWIAGGNPSRGSYQSHVEIYQPAYLFQSDGSLATRPSISSAPSSISYGHPFTVQTPGASDITSAVLIRYASSTHSFGMDQRMVGMSFSAGSGSLTITAPPNGNIAPPGYYMLFILNGDGVPSVASSVLLNSSSVPAPTVSSISPNSGTTGGGTALTITGTGFQAGATVRLGGTAATNVTVVSSTSITATTAAHAAGAVNVVVTNAAQQSGTLANGYTYIVINPAPTVTSITPNAGTFNGGTSVTVTGTGFLSGATLSLGGTTATNVTVLSGASITATTPAHPAGAVNAVVTNTDNQNGTLVNGYTYTSSTPALGLVVPSGDSSSATVVAGQNASYTLSIGGSGIGGSASLSCSGAPKGANCSVPSGQSFSSTAPTTFNVSVTTTARTMAALHLPALAPAAWLWTFAMLGMVVLPGIRDRRRSLRRYLRLSPLTLLLFLASCGGGAGSSGGQPPTPNPNGTPAGTYTLNVTATSGTTSQTTSLTMIVK
jgi:hypothetical protein